MSGSIPNTARHWRRAAPPRSPGARRRRRCGRAGPARRGCDRTRRRRPRPRSRPSVGVELDCSQALVQSAAPGQAAPLVTDHPVGDPVQPHQRRLTGRHLAEAAPHGEERVGDGVIHRVAAAPAGRRSHGSAGSTVRRAARTADHRRNVRRPQGPSRRSYPVNAQHTLTRDTEIYRVTEPALPGVSIADNGGCRRPAPGLPTRTARRCHRRES